MSAPSRPGLAGGAGGGRGTEDALFAFAPERACELAGRHGTPCFVYDVGRAAAAFRRLSAALPARVAVAYAVKANPHPVLLARLAAEGARFDCASAGELRKARAALLDSGAVAHGAPESLLFAGPGKRGDELALALTLGARVQAEGWEDLARLEALAAARGDRVAVNLRVHPRHVAAEARTILGGSGPSAFGVDEEDLPELLSRARALHHVRIEGLHVFAASNQREAQALLATWGHVFALAGALQQEHGLRMEQIDLGGGLGVPYAPHETPLDVDALGAGLAELLSRHGWFRGSVLLEPGRFLAAGCGDYLARVVRSKRSRGVRFAILEGGINHLLRPLLTGQPFPVRRVGPAQAGTTRDEGATGSRRLADAEARSAPEHDAVPGRTVLAGPLCTALDRLGEVVLPELQPGDLLAFGMAGAYGATEAMGDFLSHPRPPEIWVEAGDDGPRGVARG